MPIDTLKDLQQAAQQMSEALQAYALERENTKRYWLKDRFRKNLADPHSQSRRLAIVEYLMLELKQFTDSIPKMQQDVQQFAERGYQLLATIHQQIEDINEPSSQLQQLLCTHRDQLTQQIYPRLPGQSEILQKMHTLQRQHYNNVFANDLKRYMDKRSRDTFTLPQIYVLRVIDIFSPKKRDARMAGATGFMRQLQRCETAQDYVDFIENSAKTILSIKDVTSDLRAALLQTHEKIIRDIAAGKLNGFSDQQKKQILQAVTPYFSKNNQVLKNYINSLNTPVTLPTSAILLDNNKTESISKHAVTTYASAAEKYHYFSKNLHELFIYRVIGHGVVAGGVVKREEGLIGKIGLRVCIFDPRLPGTSIAAGAISGALQMADYYKIEKQSIDVISEIPYNMIQQIAGKVTEKLAHRFAAQITALYHSEHYTAAIDKLMSALLDNILENIKSAQEVIITDPLQAKRYVELMVLKKNHALTPAQVQELTEINVEIIANKVCAGASKNLTRLPIASYLPFTHLMHQEDKHGLMGGKKWNTHDIFTQPGYAVIDEKNQIKFYGAKGLKPEKYGYILVTLQEIALHPQRHLLTELKVDENTCQHYQQLHLQYQPQQPKLAVTTSTIEVLPATTAKAQAEIKQAPACQQLADALKAIIVSVNKFNHPLLDAQQSELLDMRKVFNSVKDQIKQFDKTSTDKLRDKEVLINPAAKNGKMLLGQWLEFVDSKLKEHEQKHANNLLNDTVASPASVSDVKSNRLSVASLLPQRPMRVQ